jgi:hypothetical protein
MKITQPGINHADAAGTHAQQQRPAAAGTGPFLPAIHTCNDFVFSISVLAASASSSACVSGL